MSIRIWIAPFEYNEHATYSGTISLHEFSKSPTESWWSCLVLQSFFKYFSNYIELK